MLRPVLLAKYGSVRLFDRVSPAVPQAGEEIVVGDASDLDQMVAATRDIDCVLHFAGIPKEDTFPAILSANVVSTYNAFEAARQCGVRRVVFASSNHVIGFHRSSNEVGLDAELRPDSRYGVSKVFGEAVARLYADKYAVSAICLRFGSVRERPEDKRQLATWMSPRDTAALVVSAIETPDIRYAVAYGVSANTRNRWSNSGMVLQGFEPKDNAEIYAADLPSSVHAENPVARAFHGGPFAAEEFTGAIDSVD